MATSRKRPSSHEQKKELYLVGGEKGGVGKTTVALTLVDCSKARSKNVIAIEADTSNRDFYRQLESSGLPLKTARFSEDRHDSSLADQIFILAAESPPGAILVVNLPANVAEAMDRYFESTEILEILDQHNVLAYHYYTIKSDLTLDPLKESVQRYQHALKHVVVKNLHECPSRMDPFTGLAALEPLFLEHNIPVIQLRELDVSTMRQLVDRRILFSAAKSTPGLSLTHKQRAALYLRRAADEFTRAQLQIKGV